MLHIGRWIKQDNPARAETFVQELYDRCEALEHMPRAFPCYPAGKIPVSAVVPMATTLFSTGSRMMLQRRCMPSMAPSTVKSSYSRRNRCWNHPPLVSIENPAREQSGQLFD